MRLQLKESNSETISWTIKIKQETTRTGTTKHRGRGKSHLQRKKNVRRKTRIQEWGKVNKKNK